VIPPVDVAAGEAHLLHEAVRMPAVEQRAAVLAQVLIQPIEHLIEGRALGRASTGVRCASGAR
jgi:hypothetical protein